MRGSLKGTTMSSLLKYSEGQSTLGGIVRKVDSGRYEEQRANEALLEYG